MEQVIAVLDERLANPGDTLPVAGHLDEPSYSLGNHDFTLPQGIDYDLMLTNAGEGILATGILRAHVEGVCDRCLDPASFDVAGEVDEYYLFEEPDEAAYLDDEDEEMDFSLVGDDNTVDLTDALFSALLMETPYVVLCREDCKGLCPVCGANLNEEDCGHAAQIEAEREQARLEASPFAALKNLKRRGHFVQIGMGKPEIPFYVEALNYKEPIVTGSLGSRKASWEQALDLLGRGKVKVDKIADVRMPLADWEKAFDMFRKKEGGKFILFPFEEDY